MSVYYLQSPLKAACRNGHTEIVALLLTAKKIDVNKGAAAYIQSPLAIASENGHTEVVALLLKADGIDVNLKVSIMISVPIMSLFTLR